MDKNSNDNKMQENCSVKSAVTFDQIQVPYCDFKQRPTKIESLRGLLHPTIDEHGSAEPNDKQKTEAPTSARKPAPKKLRLKDEMSARKREIQRKKSSSKRLTSLHK